MGDLDNLRKRIDKIDSKIVILIKKRFEIAIKILNFKKKKNLKVYQPKRENSILKKLKPAYKPIFREIIKQSRKIQIKKWK